MSVRVQHRRGTTAQNTTFTGAAGELVVDSTTNIPRLHDGVTVAGFPLALAGRTAVSDAAYAVLVTDRLITYTALTSARIVTLPSAALYPAGATLQVVDESGSCSATLTITLARAGSDTIDGATSLVLNGAYAAVAIESNGSNAWTVLSRQLTGFTTPRTTVADTAYTVLATDREVAYTSITAARVVSLPAASAFPVGVDLLIADESGSVSTTNMLTINRAGSDTIASRLLVLLSTGFGWVRLRSNGSNAWIVVGRSTNVVVISSSGTYTPGAGLVAADVFAYGAGGGGGSGAMELTNVACSGGGGGGGGYVSIARGLTAAQLGTSQAVTIGSGGSAGVAPTINTTAGGNGGQGGFTSLGTFTTARGGGGGAGGQLAATGSGGGGGAGSAAAGGNATSATGGTAGSFGGTAGGTATGGTVASSLQGGVGAPGCSVAGVAGAAPAGVGGGGAGGAGGGLSAVSATNVGTAGSNQVANGNAITGGTAGAANTSGGAGVNPTIASGSFGAGSGGGGGGSGASGTAGSGNVGGTASGGGGGGSMVNGGTAGAGGAGGGGLIIIIEFFS